MTCRPVPKFHVADSVGAFICDVFYRHGGGEQGELRSRPASLNMGTVTSLRAVLDQLKAQHPDEIIMAPNLDEKDFSKVMEASLVQLLSSYGPENVRRPVECIGLQPSLLPDDIMKLKTSHLEYFFHPDQGVLNHLGLPHIDPQSVFHEPVMKGIPKIKFVGTGVAGLELLLSKPIMSGDGYQYFENVTCSTVLGFMSFHGPYNMRVFGNQGFVTVEGASNTGKSTNAKIALHLASDQSQFLSFGTSLPGLREIGQKWSLLQVVDDNKSLAKLAASSGLEAQERIALVEILALHDRLGQDEGGAAYRGRLEELGEGEVTASQGRTTPSQPEPFAGVDLEKVLR